MLPPDQTQVVDFLFDPQSPVEWDAIRHGAALEQLVADGLLELRDDQRLPPTVPGRALSRFYVHVKELSHYIAAQAIRSVLLVFLLVSVSLGIALGVAGTLLALWVL